MARRKGRSARLETSVPAAVAAELADLCRGLRLPVAVAVRAAVVAWLASQRKAA